VLEKLAAGNLKSLIGYDEAELDDTGNIELRCWACAAGALGERKPDVVSMDPSWHHNYASLAWIGGNGEQSQAAHYPSIKPELVELTTALHGLAHDAGMRTQYMADAVAFADKALNKCWIEEQSKTQVMSQIKSLQPKETALQIAARKMCQKLVREAVLIRGAKDNTTCITILFGEPN